MTKNTGYISGNKPHSKGGIDVIVKDTKQVINVESKEYQICKQAMESTDILFFKNKTNIQILDAIHSKYNCPAFDKTAKSGDFIVCKIAVADDKPRRRVMGTASQIVNAINGIAGGRVDGETAEVVMKKGGKVDGKTNLFMRWYVKWYKKVSDKMNILITLPTLDTKGGNKKNIVSLDVFEKIDQNTDAKPYLQEIINKADEYNIIIFLEATPRHKEFIENNSKKDKITTEYLVKYYEKFGFRLLQDTDYMIGEELLNYKFMERLPKEKMEQGGELAKGIKTEMEHKSTIDKFKRKGISDKEVAKSIAEDHLKEDSSYYSKLAKMEGKMEQGGEVDDFDKNKIELVSVNYLNNIRSQDKSRWDYDLEKSIEKYGIKKPLTIGHWVEDGYVTLLDGHHRLDTAIDLGIEKVPTKIQIMHDNPIGKIKVYKIADLIEKKMENGGKLIKRADGTYSKRGLYDNIRDNIGSGKKPTKQMLEQEAKIKAQKMEDGGTILLAPNGKPSNLTAKQWHLVRTPQFKQWFGDWEKLAMAKIKDSAMDEVTLANISKGVSKVVDENGEPKVMYHGSRGDFNVFSNENTNKLLWTEGGLGFYFTSYSVSASAYGTRIIGAFINSRNIKKSDESEHAFVNAYQLKKLHEQKFDSIYFDGQFTKTNGLRGWKEDELVVFERNQIKLADGTNTTFDGNNDDIRYEDGGGIEFVPEKKGTLIKGNEIIKYFEKVNGNYRLVFYTLNETKGKVPTMCHSFGYCEELDSENVTPKELVELIKKNNLMEEGGEIGTLLAPNGKPSNLTPEQYKLVRTPAFKKWFGDWENDAENSSKVVDENGEPMVVYHGSSYGGINVFDISQSKRESSGLKEYGNYFTTNKKLADFYHKKGKLEKEEVQNIDREIYKLEQLLYTIKNNRDFDSVMDEIKKLKRIKDGNVYPVFLNLKKIHEFDAKGKEEMSGWRELKVWAGYKWANNRDAMDFLKEGKFEVGKVNGIKAKNIIDAFVQGDKFLSKELLSDVYLVFSANDIKLADGTNTTFDGNNDDIRYEKGGTITDQDKKETYAKWKSLVNMSKSELKEFYDSQEGKDAGLSTAKANSLGISNGRESARWIMRMKDTPVSDWTPSMWKWANKQISFISRMSGNKGSLYDDNGNKTRKHTSLLIWGHNPEKYEKGGEVGDTKKNNTFTKNEFKGFWNWQVEFYKANNDTPFKSLKLEQTNKQLDLFEAVNKIKNNAIHEYSDFPKSKNDKLVIYITNGEFFPEYKQIKLAEYSQPKGLELFFDWNNNGTYTSLDVVKYKYEKGGNIEPKQNIYELTLYQVQVGGDSHTEHTYNGIDLEEAKIKYNYADIDDLSQSDKYSGGVVILEKQTNKYEFIYDLDEDESLYDYPIDDYYNDSDYYELIEEGDYEEIENRNIKGTKYIDEENQEQSKDVLDEVISYFEKKYPRHTKAGYHTRQSSYILIPVENTDKTIELRISDHTPNLSNIHFNPNEVLETEIVRMGEKPQSIDTSNPELYEITHNDMGFAIYKQVKPKNRVALINCVIYYGNDDTYSKFDKHTEYKVINEYFDLSEKTYDADIIIESIEYLIENEINEYDENDDVFAKGGKISNELKKGIKVEKEHKYTAKKIYNHEITPDQAPMEIAKDHIDENPNYYEDLEESGIVFEDGGEINTENKTHEQIEADIINQQFGYIL